jgi:myosin heavy subunit
MAQNEEIILEVKFTDDNTAKRMAEIQNALAELNAEYSNVKKAIKESGETTAEQARIMGENRAEVKALTNEMKFYEKQLNAEAKQNKDLGDSINAMRTNLSKMVAQYDALSKAERENIDIGGKLLDQINEQTDAIKDAEYATQRYQRNVGNYENAIKNALPKQLQFVSSVADSAKEAGGAVPMMKGLQAGIVSVTKAAIAFIATPIGAVITAIVVVIALLVAGFKTLQKAFQRTETNGDKLATSMGKLKGLMNAFYKAIEPIAKWFADTFAKAIDFIIEKLGNLIEGLQDALRWLAETTDADWLKDMSNGLDNVVKKTGEMVAVTSELATAEEKLHRMQRESKKIQYEAQIQAENLRQLRDDESKSLKERTQANEELNKVLKKQLNDELAIANYEVKVAKMRIKANGETKDNLDALADAEVKVLEIRERVNSQVSEYKANINSLRREAQQTIKVVDDIYKEIKMMQAEAEVFLEKSILYNDPKRPKPINYDSEEDEEIEDVTKIYKERNNLRLQYEKMGFDERLKLQKQNLDLERAQRIASGEDAINTELWYQGELTRITAENAEARKQYALDVANASMAGASQMISSLKELAEVSGASAEYQKALALAEVAINTGQAISAGIASAMATPFPANIGAILTTIASVISGIAQARAAINSAKVPTAKFAQGGLVTGEGTATSDSIPAMLSNGESVMTAKATSAYSPILSAMNQSVGGAPIGASTNTRAMQQLVQQFADVVVNTPIYTAVTDINEGQARVAKIVDNSNY